MKTLTKNGKHHEEIKIIERKGSLLTATIGNRKYLLDVEKVEHGVYSVLHNNTSHNMEIIKSDKKNFYTINTQYQTFDIEISAAGFNEGNAKKKSNNSEKIVAPIPGKVIAVKISPGDPVEEDQTVVILSAMKMENELKSPIDGIITKVNTKTDAIVKEGSVLIEVKAVDA
jgi:biotin carboxyl carrier protein